MNDAEAAATMARSRVRASGLENMMTDHDFRDKVFLITLAEDASANCRAAFVAEGACELRRQYQEGHPLPKLTPLPPPPPSDCLR